MTTRYAIMAFQTQTQTQTRILRTPTPIKGFGRRTAWNSFMWFTDIQVAKKYVNDYPRRNGLRLMIIEEDELKQFFVKDLKRQPIGDFDHTNAAFKNAYGRAVYVISKTENSVLLNMSPNVELRKKAVIPSVTAAPTKTKTCNLEERIERLQKEVEGFRKDVIDLRGAIDDIKNAVHNFGFKSRDRHEMLHKAVIEVDAKHQASANRIMAMIQQFTEGKRSSWNIPLCNIPLWTTRGKD